MPEIAREELLAARQEEMQRLQDKLNLDHMLKAQSGNVDSEHVSQAAKRECLVLKFLGTGATLASRETRRPGCHKGEVTEVGRIEGKKKSEGRKGPCRSANVAFNIC
jgi:hypothetical protein